LFVWTASLSVVFSVVYEFYPTVGNVWEKTHKTNSWPNTIAKIH